MNRITVDPKVMGGVPCLRGLRIPVATVVNMVAVGLSVQEIVDELPPLEADDVAAALRFAADAGRIVRSCFKPRREVPHRRHQPIGHLVSLAECADF